MYQVRILNGFCVQALGLQLIIATVSFALSSSCFLDTQTNFCETTGLRCKEGQVCAPLQGICVDLGGCGDGVVNEDEDCDDGNRQNSDGCDDNCKWTGCGNGIATGSEQCDLGKLNSDAGLCLTTCQKAECGDGKIYFGFEQCDDGLMNSDVGGCLTACVRARCGDGHVRADGYEQCDDGNDLTCGTCDRTCQAYTFAPAKGTIELKAGANVIEYQWFQLNDGAKIVKFVYVFTSDPVTEGFGIQLLSAGDRYMFAAVTAQTINAVASNQNLQIVAESDGTQVKLTHRQFGVVGNAQIESIDLSSFMVTGMDNGRGFDCPRDVGCMSNNDCLSGMCDQLTHRCQ